MVRNQVAFCDLEISVPAITDAVTDMLVRRLTELGAPKGSKLIVEADGREIDFGAAEGLALYLNRTDLPVEVYKTNDVNHVIAECNRLLGAEGGYRSYWQGSRETSLYFYGASFAAMQTAIEPFVASYPLCRKARIERIA